MFYLGTDEQEVVNNDQKRIRLDEEYIDREENEKLSLPFYYDSKLEKCGLISKWETEHSSKIDNNSETQNGMRWRKRDKICSELTVFK